MEKTLHIRNSQRNHIQTVENYKKWKIHLVPKLKIWAYCLLSHTSLNLKQPNLQKWAQILLHLTEAESWSRKLWDDLSSHDFILSTITNPLI